MSDQVRGIIFVLVALIILFVWQHFYKPAVPPPQSGSAPAAQTAPATGPSTAATPAQKSIAPSISASTPAANPVATQAAEEKTIAVDSAFYRVELSNRGAAVHSWTLQKYFDDQKPPRPLDLVNSDSARQLGWPFSLQLGNAEQTQQANSALYQVSATPPRGKGEPAAAPAAITASSLRAPVEVTFHWSDGHLDITKKLIFKDDYEMSAEVSAALDGKPLQVALAWRGGFGDKEVYKASSLVSVFYNQGGKLSLLQYKKLGVSGNQAQPAQQVGPLDYAGIEDQFFTAAFLPEGTDLSEWHWTENHNITEDGKPGTEPVAEMAVGSAAPGPLKARIFVGPKDLDILTKQRPPLEDLVQFGWTGIIAKPLLYSLRWLHKYIPNYGWAIVVLTLVINLAMFPLKMKSWRSMQKMQKVAPEVRSIQDRYKKYSMSDPRKKKMNEEVMAIYQREGINPMGSCLPMLFQMPIWWALWRVLNGAIELRHAVWLGWIHDLSAKDPYYILPILMTITMYLTTKMTPQTSIDPAQQKMQQFMPLMFAVIFFNLSSGLNLYMFTSNLVAVGQQVYLNRSEPLPDRSKFKNKKKE